MLYDWKYPFNEKLGKLMKKNRIFIFIMALMITLLLVVGCDVSSISDTLDSDNQYVEFKLSVKEPNSRVIEIDSSLLNISNYRIALIPEWDTLKNGTPIYGKIGSRNVDGTVIYGDATYTSVDQISLGYVTPGKWTVYVAAFNSDNKVILDGYTSTYVNSANDIVSVCLSPSVTTVSEHGSIYFYIFVPRLTENHTDSYGVRYTLYNSMNSVVSLGDIPGHIDILDASHVWYYLDSSINDLKAGEYIINIVLYDKKDGSSIGGITKKLSIISGATTNIGGSLSPSEFVNAKLDYNLPVLNAVVENVDPSLQVLNSAIVFTCNDTTPTISGYTKSFHWFIDGKHVSIVSPDNKEAGKWEVIAMSDNEDSSSITCKFYSYGRREIRCEVVYIPVVSKGEDNSKQVRLVGGDSTFVEIIPRKLINQ